MAFVKQVGKMFGVFHEGTKKILVRGGRSVKHTTLKAAQADVRATRRRITGR